MSSGILAALALQCAGAVAPADILAMAHADVPFARQSGYYGQVLGSYPRASAIPESGIHGPALPGGETLRFGKVPDPAEPRRNAFAFRLAPQDPRTAGSRRAEIKFGPDIEMERVYWAALSVYVPDWGSPGAHDVAVLGTQLHPGDDRLGLSPTFSIVARGRSFHIAARHSEAAPPTPRDTRTQRYAQQPIRFGRWMDFVFRFRLSTGREGFLQAWLDGEKIAEHRGALGFHTPGYRDYFKFGYYNWSPGFDSPRLVLVRSPVVVADPQGARYRPEDLRSLLNQCVGGT